MQVPALEADSSSSNARYVYCLTNANSAPPQNLCNKGNTKTRTRTILPLANLKLRAWRGNTLMARRQSPKENAKHANRENTNSEDHTKQNGAPTNPNVARARFTT